ncbi:hypothetical protein QBC38DRAFT_527104 [Podospora fimiseda]|uniref:F-box domain-containing protein n=1 Tax=Podospora fimiseda TaxID=252190 RepID=A0AAN7BPV3_9PEZI|nr:hypothetical protein QBC38DRAFT_527104 [Podospora fimiseda]
MACLGNLPGEILLHIFSFLKPEELTSVQLVSRDLSNLSRDNNYWRSRCLQDSSYLANLERRRQVLQDKNLVAAATAHISSATGVGASSSANGSDSDETSAVKIPFIDGSVIRDRERARIMANWDPIFPGEKVSWYNEYIQRHGPAQINWLQLPYQNSESGDDQDSGNGKSSADFVEARGLALYYPDVVAENDGSGGPKGRVLAVSPLDDGSVCLWDVGGGSFGEKRGAIVARSKPGILFIDGPRADNSRRSKRVDSGVTECISVDSWKHLAFFAVQSHLIQVDLQTLTAVDCEPFTWSIATLSTASPQVPLTVGTSFGIHLYDYRQRRKSSRDIVESVDCVDRTGTQNFYERSLRHIFDDEPLPPYASLAQPGPLSIVHLQRPGQPDDLSDDIYVAGRFSNILHYDRRMFPSIKGSIHSGARLSSITSLPYPFSALDTDLRRKGELSLEQVQESKNGSGRTLIACGEYNTKGSLELYGLSADQSEFPRPGGLQTSTFKNRQTASQSKVLSVVNHGSRIAFSDGMGYINWFERDGFTEVCRHKIGHNERSEGPSIFASMPGIDDIARKLLPTRPGGQGDNIPVNGNDLLFWTGEKLGLLSFSSLPGFMPEDFEELEEPDSEELVRAAKEREYKDGMRRALQKQADDARWVQNFGGPGD